MGNVRVRGVRVVHGNVPIASSWRKPARTANRCYNHAAIGLAFVLERQGSISVRSAVGSLIPTPQIKTTGNSADRLDVDVALRVHGHAGLDSLACSRGQTQTLIGSVFRGSRTNVCRNSLTVRAVVLGGWVAGWNGGRRIDSDWEIGDSGGRVEPDGIPQEVSIGGGNGK